MDRSGGVPGSGRFDLPLNLDICREARLLPQTPQQRTENPRFPAPPCSLLHLDRSNRMSRQTLMAVLLASTVVLLILAAATLVPSSSLLTSDLGYSTFCPFAPWSTFTLLFFAGLSWIVRRHVQSQPPAGE